MFLKLQPLIYSIIFLLSLETVVLKENWMENIAWILILLTILIVWPLTRKPRFIALPLFLSLGALALLSLIDHIIERHIFIFLTSGIYYLTLLGGYRLRFYSSDQTALGMINLATLYTAFMWFTAGLGFYLNYQVQYWMIVLFIGTVFLIALPSFCTNAKDAHDRFKKKGLSSLKTKFIGIIFLNLILAFLMSQLFWGILFWPFGYLTLGGSALIIFYEFWDAVRLFVRDELTAKKLVVNMVVGLFLLVGILLTAQWSIIPRV
jgi:hypothetical protein